MKNKIFSLIVALLLCINNGIFAAVVDMLYDENDVFVQYITQNIEDIKVGDLVYNYDTITGEVSQQMVAATYVLESNHVNYLTFIDENGNEQIIESTDVHPFWVVTNEPDLSRAARSIVDENGVIFYHENIAPGLNGFWVEARDLQVGDVFLGANGELSTLVAAERVVFPEGIKVYNFTVDGNHNYFVIAKCDEFGQTCVLVHNSCTLKEGDIVSYADWKAWQKVNPGSGLVGHHPISQKVLEANRYNVNEAPVVIMKALDHHRTANFGWKGASQGTDLVQGIVTGFNDKILQQAVGKRFDELWQRTYKFLGWR